MDSFTFKMDCEVGSLFGLKIKNSRYSPMLERETVSRLNQNYLAVCTVSYIEF
jgi:hypothetical protein